jgi:hypothetical protein
MEERERGLLAQAPGTQVYLSKLAITASGIRGYLPHVLLSQANFLTVRIVIGLDRDIDAVSVIEHSQNMFL